MFLFYGKLREMKKIFFGIAVGLCTVFWGGFVQAATYKVPYLSLKRTPYAKANKKKIYNYKYYYKRNWNLPRNKWDSRFTMKKYRFSSQFKSSDYEKWRMMSGDSHDLTATEYNQSNNGGITREMARQVRLEESAKRKKGQMCGESFLKDTDITRWACECDNSLEYAERKWECDNKRQEFCQYTDSEMGEYLRQLDVHNRCCICNNGWVCEYSSVAGNNEEHACSWDVEATPVTPVKAK